MPIFEGDDDQSAALGERFERWLRGRAGLPDAHVDFFGAASSGTGWSNETFKATISRSAGAAPENVILRLPPSDEALFRDYDIARQYNTMKALEGISDLPVAPCLWLETDPEALGRAFYVMEMVEGRIPADKPLYMTEGWVVDAMDEERRALWCSSIAIIANLSRVDWRARGLEPYAWPDRNRLAIDQHLAMWEDLYDWGASLLPQERHPLVEEVRLWLRKDMPHDETQAFIWGDCRFGNFVYQDFKPVGLLDWELAVVGDPECDFSYFLLAHRHLELLGSGGDRMKPRLGGFLSDEESIDYYEQYRGRKMRHYDYYWMFNAFKIYAIRQRIAALSIKWKTLSVEDAMQLRKIPTLEEETASRLR